MVDAAKADVVAVLTRAPSAGGKTRLFETLRCAPDSALLAALLLDTLDGIASTEYRRVIAVEPASAQHEVHALAAHEIDVLPQVAGSLGERMRAIFDELLRGGARRVALIGSDLPSITSRPILDAFAALRSDGEAIVLGPADDGGYYLIAAAHVPDVFDEIAWGTPLVLAQTQDAARRAGRRVLHVGPCSDVDTAADLERLLRSRLDNRASRTMAWARARAEGLKAVPP